MALPVRRDRDDHPAPFTPVPGVARWGPFDELDRLDRQLARFFESFSPFRNLLDGAFNPLADIEETEDAYLVEVELPGVERDDVDIEITGRRVTVHGERKERERVGILRRRERTVGRVHHEVTLPGDIDRDGVEAHLDEGVLTLRLPKPEHERPRRIQIA